MPGAVTSLHDRLAAKVDAWRASSYPADAFPAIAEILEWARESDTGALRFLRRPQLRALETYWYLRVVEGTPDIPTLYTRLFPNISDRLEALGLGDSRITRVVVDSGIDGLLERVRRDDEFVRAHGLQAVRETLTLAYPSYILALAMGAGKTILIGATIATEFAMAMEYPDGGFVENALVFAPGKTILQSLKELVAVPYDRILLPRLHKRFAASVKLTFTRDGEKDLPVIRGSSFNVVVTNTEKIRIRKEDVRKSDLAGLFPRGAEDVARQELANLRLQAVASLPHLAVFSDEAHHTYGQSLDAELKKVRLTVDYLHANTRVACVVNTTGTPYFQRQPLRDVVIWYGLAEGVRDGILKDVAGSIHSYDFEGRTEQYVSYVIEDFFAEYGNVTLPNGAPAKLALYFPQTDDLAALKPVVDAAMTRAGLGPAACLVNTSDSSLTKTADIDAFNRLNDPAAPHRVMLLVNKGTEGWNCPSLFACALVRKLRTSNNFVLQAATRCLRQVPGNTHKARIYLSSENFAVLDKQLQETYGESIATLNADTQERRTARVVLRRVPIPPLLVRQIVRTVARRESAESTDLTLQRPEAAPATATARRYTVVADLRGRHVLQPVGDTLPIADTTDPLDVRMVAVDFAAQYRLDPLDLVARLQAVYPSGEIPPAHIGLLAEQVEAQTRQYETREEQVDVALALVKEDGFERETDATGAVVYTAQIVYPVAKEKLLVDAERRAKQNAAGYGFFISPLRFDSEPEISFFDQVLSELNLSHLDVEDMYYTGDLTDSKKTDFAVQYKDDAGKWRRYTPDFVIRKKPPRGRPAGSGRVYIVEIKSERERQHPIDGATGKKAMALQRWTELNPDRLKYEMIFTSTGTVSHDQLRSVRKFCEEPEVYLPIPVDSSALSDFCRRWKIRELAVFGSVLREDFRPDSDVDFLATFAPDAPRGLVEEDRMRDELRTLVGRQIDLVSRRAVERSPNWIRRRSILESARTIYVER